MPIIVPFVIQSVVPALTTIFTLLVPVLAAVINFALTRIPRIPSYIRFITILYSDPDIDASARKIITGGLLIIGSVLTFMAYSLIPWTGVPLIGGITSAIAGTIAVVVALTVLDTIFALNEGYYLKRLKQKGLNGLNDLNALNNIESDIKNLKDVLGKSWHNLKNTINNASQKIYEEGSKQGINFSDEPFQNYLEHELDGLKLYVGKTSGADYQSISTDLLKQNNGEDWTKDVLNVSTGVTLGGLAGVGTSTVASSLLVQASIWTSIQGFFGISTGIVVSASTYSLLTLAAPIGLGLLAGVGIYSGLTNLSNKEQAAKMSKFLAEIIIAAVPMAWIDGELSSQEQDAIDRLMTASGMREAERKEVQKAIEKRQTFDEIMRTSIPFDEKHRDLKCRQSDNERLKHRLILCTAWEIAIADGKIQQSELQLHNRMADKLNISRDEVKEIRRTINLKHEQELSEVVELKNRSKTKLRSVREQYRLLPAADNL